MKKGRGRERERARERASAAFASNKLLSGGLHGFTGSPRENAAGQAEVGASSKKHSGATALISVLPKPSIDIEVERVQQSCKLFATPSAGDGNAPSDE